MNKHGLSKQLTKGTTIISLCERNHVNKCHINDYSEYKCATCSLTGHAARLIAELEKIVDIPLSLDEPRSFTPVKPKSLVFSNAKYAILIVIHPTAQTLSVSENYDSAMGTTVTICTVGRVRNIESTALQMADAISHNLDQQRKNKIASLISAAITVTERPLCNIVCMATIEECWVD